MLVHLRMLTLSVILVGFVNLCKSFPFPEQCGVNYISPDNIQNASRFVNESILIQMRGR